MIYLPQDPAGVERLASKMQAVCASVSAGDQVTKEKLKDLAKKREQNPLNYVNKNDQSFSNTCGANSGEQCLSIWYWKHTGLVLDFARLWLYLSGKLRWDTKRGRFPDNGVSIPSVAETLYEQGVPFERFWKFNPDASKWPTAERFKAEQTPELIAAAAQHKCKSMTPVSQDFDVAVARVALGDPFFWGHGWPFPNGGSGHATCGAWFEWDEKLKDFVLIMSNSHANQPVFRCTRRQYATALRSGNYGGYHMEGNADLKFRANQMVM
jgi:hypothetical protein